MLLVRIDVLPMMPASKEELIIFKNIIKEVEENHELHTASENIYLLLILSRLMYCRLRMLTRNKQSSLAIVTENGLLTRHTLEERMKLRVKNLKSIFETYSESDDVE